MSQPGHVLIGAQGEFIGVDGAFCDIMRSGSSAIIGRQVLDVTAAADRQECAEAIHQLRETKRPFVITKRLLRDDGSLIWVKNAVSITSDAATHDTIIATIEPVAERAPEESPIHLVDTAEFLISAASARSKICDPAMFLEPAWNLILTAYIAEAEGLALDVQAQACVQTVSSSTVDRWIKALIASDVLEVEYRSPACDAPKTYRLTRPAHARLETYLENLRQNLRVTV